jgi:hypothetical protein
MANPIFGGYAINFRGCNITMESLMGTKPIGPSEMTKKLWAYVKRQRLAYEVHVRRISHRSGASRATQISTGKRRLVVVPSQNRSLKAALLRALEQGESSTVEFKEALRWDHLQNAGTRSSVAEAAAIKTIAGFLNSKHGGTLVIGIADDKKTVGLDGDYRSLSGGREQRDADRFQLHLRQIVAAAQIGRHIINQCIEMAVVPHEEKDVCVIHVRPSPTPIYVGHGRTMAFYLRVGPATQELNLAEAVAFCRKRWSRET